MVRSVPSAPSSPIAPPQGPGPEPPSALAATPAALSVGSLTSLGSLAFTLEEQAFMTAAAAAAAAGAVVCPNVGGAEPLVPSPLGSPPVTPGRGWWLATPPGSSGNTPRGAQVSPAEVAVAVQALRFEFLALVGELQQIAAGLPVVRSGVCEEGGDTGELAPEVESDGDSNELPAPAAWRALAHVLVGTEAEAGTEGVQL